MKLNFSQENSVDGVSGQLSTTAALNSQGNQSVTLDDGDGEKDLIVMTGPLGEAYTKALGVYFAKKPIGEPSDGGEIEKYPGDTSEATKSEDKAENQSVASETAALDTTIGAALADVAAADINFPGGVAPRLQLRSQYDDFDMEPDATIFVVDDSRLGQPQNVQVIQAAAKVAQDCGREFAIMVTEVKPNGTIVTDAHPKLEFNNKKSIINVDDNFEDSTDPLDDEEREANRLAVEGLFEGIPVLRGVKGFHSWIEKRYKK